MRKRHNIDRFKGYPHYPSREDITRPDNNNGRRLFEEQNNLPVQRPFNDAEDVRDKDARIVPGTDADVTNEDLRVLSEADQSTPDSMNIQFSSLDNTDSDGDLLNEVSSLNQDMTGGDLDVPGSKADDANERMGEEDEENNYYSLGGDNHESQEEYKGE
jgi:hypothetical protein